MKQKFPEEDPKEFVDLPRYNYKESMVPPRATHQDMVQRKKLAK